jgi:hypothetical protein
MIRLGDAKHALLNRAAERSGLTISGYAASASLAAAAGKPAPDDRQTEHLLAELMATRAQLRRYGNNVNQTARTLNAGGDPPERPTDVIALERPSRPNIDRAVQDLLLEEPRSRS